MKYEDVVIIGGGPAGIAACIQLKRHDIDPMMIEKDRLGGLLWNANLVENYPGFWDGITGPKLVCLMERHLLNNDVRIRYSTVKEVDHDGHHFILQLDDEMLRTSILVIASGTRPVGPNIQFPPGISDRIHTDVRSLLKETDARIVIMGGGDAAFDYALNLADSNEIVILNRSEKTKCLPLLFARAGQDSAITYHASAEISRILMVGESLEIHYVQHGMNHHVNADHFITAIGREPSLEFLAPHLESRIKSLEEEGLLYLIGDVKNGANRQVSIAVGDGIDAAMRIARILPEKPE